MGQEIRGTSFTQADEQEYHRRLREETKILKRWFDHETFDNSQLKCGIELEAWLTTRDFIPWPKSDKFIEKLNDPMVVPEISKFNFELNTNPYEIEGKAFSKLEKEVLQVWENCQKTAEEMKLKAVLIGTLPTLRDYMLTMDNLSPQKRYSVLNKRVMDLRGDAPIVLDIQGRDAIHVEHNNVITECAATSLQTHFGCSQKDAPKYYNASIIASSLIAAVCANSPYFYGKSLWDETRVPVFEQSVNVKAFHKLHGETATRVTLGNGYVHDSLLELFIENLDGYPILLPEITESDPEWLNHLRLHNGTIWRWNRPLIGLNQDGTPSLRLEFRVPSAGPSIKDSVANAIFQIGLVHALFKEEGIEKKIPFNVARENFYSACKEGFVANLKWTDGKMHTAQQLLMTKLLPEIRNSLKELGIDQSEIEHYIDGVIKPRLVTGQNGAEWQKKFVQAHGPRFQELMEAYYANQIKNIPVHEWDI